MIQSVVRALRLLEALDQAGEAGAALRSLAEQTELKRPTAHNLLQTLVATDYAAQAPHSRSYILGERACKLGHGRFLATALSRAAAPAVRELRDQFDETVLLTVYREVKRHTILTLESHQAVRVGAGRSVDALFYSTATGRLLLSMLDEAELGECVAKLGFPGEEWEGTTSLAGLQAKLTVIRKTQLARYHRRASDVQALAVPVVLSEFDDAVALGVYFPAYRFDPDRERVLVEALRGAAAQISAEFGCVM